MPTITSPTGQTKRVKNLGWLLSNWKKVERIELFPVTDNMRECRLLAHLQHGARYTTSWCSYAICLNWLDRPVFRGLPITDHIAEEKKNA